MVKLMKQLVFFVADVKIQPMRTTRNGGIKLPVVLIITLVYEI
jgi:hypothetical protein